VCPHHLGGWPKYRKVTVGTNHSHLDRGDVAVRLPISLQFALLTAMHACLTRAPGSKDRACPGPLKIIGAMPIPMSTAKQWKEGLGFGF